MTWLKVTLRRSGVDRPADQQGTLAGLGVRHIGQSRVLQNTPAIRGMVRKVIHLVEVEEVDEQGVGTGSGPIGAHRV